jgi:hypothetical protein
MKEYVVVVPPMVFAGGCIVDRKSEGGLVVEVGLFFFSRVIKC